jgi:predicted MFS family arabinose efflux permease
MTARSRSDPREAAAAPGLTPLGSAVLRAAFAISSAGDWIYKFAVPTLILRLTGSPLDTAFAYVLEFIPYVVIGPFAGLLADRFSRRATMVACDGGSCLLALAIAGLVQLGNPPIALLYVLALALSCTRPLYFPAFQGFLVEMVSEERRPRFNSWTQVSDGLLSLGGPVIGTAVVAAAGVPVATVLDAVSFAVSASLVATIPYRAAIGSRAAIPDRATGRDDGQPAARGAVRGVLTGLTAGFRAMVTTRAIGIGVLLVSGANLTAFIVEGNLVYLLLHVEHQPKVALGVVFSAQGAGAIAGAAVAPRLLRRIRAGLLLTAALGVFAVALIIPVIWPRYPAIVTGQGVEGAASALTIVCWFTMVQRLVPAPMIGRFVSAARAIGCLALPAGALLGAWILAASATVRTLFICAAAIQVVIALVTIRSPLFAVGAGQREPRPGH